VKILVVILIIIGVVAGGATYYTVYVSSEPKTSFRTVPIKRDDIVSTISATGTVEAEENVDIGAQVTGPVKDLGLDPSDPEKKKRIDYGSVVHEGTILAYIDDSVYKAQVDQAQAGYLRSQADLKQLQAKLLQSENDRKRAEELRNIKDIPGTTRTIKGIADSEYDLAVANNEVAKANVAVGEATIEQNRASLDLAKRNLNYTVIKSPVEGTIVDRRVNIGQTVVANLSAVSMFLIAKDLSKMQVWASVNEADVGRIRSRPDMPVRFTVDAYQGEVFHGKVVQIRLNATMTQNVVTYTVVVAFDNSDRKLFPYMTANLQFETEGREDAMVVPNAALRWKPRPEQIVPELRDQIASTLLSKPGDRDPQAGGKPSRDAKSDKPANTRDEHGRLWVKDGIFVKPIDVQTGMTDGTQTEVIGADLKEGMQVVSGEVRGDNLADDTTNPFAPRIFRGSQGSQGQRPRQ
jgi:HlyD family secretion protein